MSLKMLPAVLVLLLAWMPAASAQDDGEPINCTIFPNTDICNMMNEALGGDGKELVANLVSDPDRLNNLLGIVVRGTPIQKFLEDVDFRLKAFETQDVKEDSTNLGFSYALDKSLQDWSSKKDLKSPLALSFDFSSKGNVAFDSNDNPADFLETTLDFEVLQFVSNASEIKFPAVKAERLQELLQQSAQIEDQEALDTSHAWREFLTTFVEDYLNKLGVTILWEASVKASLESDQSFDKKQYAYGIHGGIVARSWNDDSVFSKFNFFDYPFAFMRMLTGVDDKFTPSGRAFPAFLLGIDTVDPKDNEQRIMIVGNDNGFERVRAEIAMKSTIGRMDGGEILMSLSWRYFREINAEDALRDVDMDEQEYFAVGLEFPQGWFVTYTTGKLPFDLSDQEVWELGYQFSL